MGLRSARLVRIKMGVISSLVGRRGKRTGKVEHFRKGAGALVQMTGSQGRRPLNFRYLSLVGVVGLLEKGGTTDANSCCNGKDQQRLPSWPQPAN